MKTAGDPTKRDWIETAIQINEFHISKLKQDINWREQDTATALKRSTGSISHYLSIASWLKTHENQLRRLETMRDAIAWIKKHKWDLILGNSE